MSHLDLYQTVTNQIIAALEAGTPPWHCPVAHRWRRSTALQRDHRAHVSRHQRAAAQHAGHGLRLQPQPLADLRSRRRPSAPASARARHGSQIVFFKMHEVDGAGQPDAAGDPDRRVVPLLRAFTVFNIDQVDGLPEGLAPVPLEPGSWEPLDAPRPHPGALGALIRHGGSKAFYAPDADLIQMPPQFGL
jgi:antirestriction protein ArdC